MGSRAVIVNGTGARGKGELGEVNHRVPAHLPAPGLVIRSKFMYLLLICTC